MGATSQSSHGTVLTIRSGNSALIGDSHATYKTKSKIASIQRLDDASSLQQSTSAPDPSTTTVHLTKTNKSFDPKPFSAFWDQTPHYRDETDNAHGGSDNHNYGLDGDVLS